MAYLIEQFDAISRESLGLLSGPFDTLDEARLEYGHDEHTYITEHASPDNVKLWRWYPDGMTWQNLKAPAPKPVVQSLHGKLDLEPIIEGASFIAESFPLSEDPIYPSGAVNPLMLVCGDYAEPTDASKLYWGAQGQVLKAALLAAGLGKDKVWLTTLTKHRLLDEKDKLDHEDLRAFVPNFIKEVELINPKVIVLLGLPVARAVTGLPSLEQRLAIATTFTLPRFPKIKIRLAYHPKFVLHAGGEDSKTYDGYVRQFLSYKQLT